MQYYDLKKALRFYFITDDNAPEYSPVEQVRIALQAGASIVQYRNKSFSLRFYEEATTIKDTCKKLNVPFLINDNVLLAKAVGADGVHLGQDDDPPGLARQILGSQSIIGLSVSNLKELTNSDLSPCDYIGTGPTFPTGTKADAKPVHGLAGLKEVVDASPLPAVAIGGINNTNAAACLEQGAAGAAVISYITRAEHPLENALQFGEACRCIRRTDIRG